MGIATAGLIMAALGAIIMGTYCMLPQDMRNQIKDNLNKI